MPGQFVPSPKNLMLRLGGSRVSRTGREESGPLSDPRQIAVRAMYKTPPKTSSAPSPIRNIFASQSTLSRTAEQGFKVGWEFSFPWGLWFNASELSRLLNEPYHPPPIHSVKCM